MDSLQVTEYHIELLSLINAIANYLMSAGYIEEADYRRAMDYLGSRTG